MILPMRFAPGYDSMPQSRQTIEASAIVLNGADGLNLTLPYAIAPGAGVTTGAIYVAGFNYFTVLLMCGSGQLGVAIVTLDPNDNTTELHETSIGSTNGPGVTTRLEKEMHGLHTIKLKFFNSDVVNVSYISTLYGLYLSTI